MNLRYAIYASGELDQIVDTLAEVKKERRDLEKMGCTVRVKKIKHDDEA